VPFAEPHTESAVWPKQIGTPKPQQTLLGLLADALPG